jgi:hypothetical protein
MNLSPIALFVYNRPDHTYKTLESLIANIGFRNSLLYIFCDGAKSEKDRESVQKTRVLVHSYDLKNVTVIENEYNKGLVKSIVDGVNHVLENHDRIIVLEDDCVPAPDFLHLMNFCLDKYESNEVIMNVSGYSPPIKIPEDYPYDIYFSYRFSSWGWGTWRRSWRDYSNSPDILKIIDGSDSIKKKIDRAGLDLYPMLRRQVKGKLNSWAVFWAITIIMKDGLSINPVQSRIMNVGHDGSGTHCSPNARYDVQVSKEKPARINVPEGSIPDRRITKAYSDFLTGSFFKKTLYICYSKFGKVLHFMGK